MSRRYTLVPVVVTAVLVLGVAAFLTVRSGPPALAAGAWSGHWTASTSPVQDAGGVAWLPGTGLRGGHLQSRDRGLLTGTGSPQLYEKARVGATSWKVFVPQSSRYAVDLLVPAPAPGSVAGQNVFDVSASVGGGRTVVLRKGVDPAQWATGVPQHVTGMVVVKGDSLTIRTTARRGSSAVAGLAVTSAPRAAPRTLMDDTFTGRAGAAPPAHWRNITGSGPFGDTERQGYTAARDHSRLDGRGHLEIIATHDEYHDRWGTRPYTSARLETEGTRAIRYGRIEATLQPPAGKGMWPAVWALGVDKKTVDWPRSGEIDVVEELGSAPGTVFGHIHALGDDLDPRGSTGQPVSSYGVEHPAGFDTTRAMHTVAADIQPGAITFSLDGRPYFVATREDMRTGQQWPVGRPYYLIANLAVGGWLGDPDGTTPFPARLLIDRVRLAGWA